MHELPGGKETGEHDFSGECNHALSDLPKHALQVVKPISYQKRTIIHFQATGVPPLAATPIVSLQSSSKGDGGAWPIERAATAVIAVALVATGRPCVQG